MEILQNFSIQPDQLLTMGGILFGIVLGIFIGRAPARFGRIRIGFLRTLLRPFRLFTKNNKTSVKIRGMRNAVLTGNASIAQELERKTEIEKAITLQRLRKLTGNDEVDIDEDKFKQFKEIVKEKEQEYFLRTGKGYFHRIDEQSNFRPEWVRDGLNDDIVSEFKDNATDFFNSHVNLDANEHALYEDVEGAHSIFMFGKTDLTAYNLINEARKTINGNALKLVIALSFILTISLVIIFFFTKDTITSFAVIAIATTLMWGLQNFGYSHQQENTIRSLGKFMSHYVGHISDQFRESATQAHSVPVGNEKDPAKLREKAQTWHKIMVWMAFRSFFIETFMRNQLYQINRNSGYYQLLSNAALFIIIFVALGGSIFGFYNFQSYLETPIGLSILLSTIGLTILYIWLVRRKVIKVQVDQQDWRGFDNLKLGDKMDEVIGKYAEEIGFWKTRMDR